MSRPQPLFSQPLQNPASEPISRRSGFSLRPAQNDSFTPQSRSGPDPPLYPGGLLHDRQKRGRIEGSLSDYGPDTASEEYHYSTDSEEPIREEYPTTDEGNEVTTEDSHHYSENEEPTGEEYPYTDEGEEVTSEDYHPCSDREEIISPEAPLILGANLTQHVRDSRADADDSVGDIEIESANRAVLAGLHEFSLPGLKNDTISKDRTNHSEWENKKLRTVLQHFPRAYFRDGKEKTSNEPTREGPPTAAPDNQSTVSSGLAQEFQDRYGVFNDLGVPEPFSLDFSSLDNPDILERFDFDTFLNTEETGFGFDPNIPYTDVVKPISPTKGSHPFETPRPVTPTRPSSMKGYTGKRQLHSDHYARGDQDSSLYGAPSLASEHQEGGNSRQAGVPSKLRQPRSTLLTPTDLQIGDLQTLPFQSNDQIQSENPLNRREFCDRREGSSGTAESHKLLDLIRSLERENNLLKDWINPDSVHRGGPYFQVVYKFVGDSLISWMPPSWKLANSKNGSQYILVQNSLSMGRNEFIERSKKMAFLVTRIYSVESANPSGGPNSEELEAPPTPDPISETITFTSNEMKNALSTYLEQVTGFEELFPNFDISKEIHAPYLFWHYATHEYDSNLSCLSPEQRYLIDLFRGWVHDHYGDEYARVDDQAKRGVVSCDTIKYFIRPGDPLLIQEEGSLKAAQATSWTEERQSFHRSSECRCKNCFNKTWIVSAWHYEFDGAFYQRVDRLEITLEVTDPTDEVQINSLAVFPLEYASSDIKAALEKRGKMYWACRKKRFVSYRGEDDIDALGRNSERFMIDFPTYKKVHREDESKTKTKRTELPHDRMEVEDPPSIPELYFFPSNIVGFNLRRKQWVTLAIDQIEDVKWNKKAFESLVIEEDTKTLVRALITNRLESEHGTDILDDKGKGLTILLHGGPGTGKTFTAEGVAEMAEKPLYRVTCGDIGTKAEDVETYLESALHLGKIWDCVVLLDEADVFLQERTLSDLQRNALVTVFLRVLEYYDGILVLTSNRVGTIDEAFKSRIQVSLHYPNLNRGQRHKIWRNFIHRLKELDQPSIDFSDIECYTSELADKEMNGRQIRNAITTARQLSLFQKRDMTHADLFHVIDVAGRFDRYLSGVKEGYTDDDIARDAGLR